MESKIQTPKECSSKFLEQLYSNNGVDDGGDNTRHNFDLLVHYIEQRDKQIRKQVFEEAIDIVREYFPTCLETGEDREEMVDCELVVKLQEKIVEANK